MFEDHRHYLSRACVIVNDEHAGAIESRHLESLTEHHGFRVGLRCTRRRRVAIRNEREAHGEGSASPFAAALNANHTSMQLNELPDNRQTEPEPAMRPGRTRFLLTEPVEDIRQKLSIDPSPGIGH